MTSLMLALALVGGTVVSPATPRVEAPHVLAHYPATTPGSLIEDNGQAVSRLVWNGYTNYARQSENGCTTPWAKTGAGATCTEVTGAFGEAQTYASFTSTVGTGEYMANTVVVPSSTGPWTVSYWVRRPGGGLHTSLIGCASGSNATALGCWRSDGGECSMSQGASLAYVGTAAGMTLGDAPVKVTARMSCASAEIQIIPRFYGAQSNGAGTTEFSALTVNAGTHPHPYTKTLAANFDVAPTETGSGSFAVAENGTITLATASPLFPGGMGTGRRGVGPFTDSNWLGNVAAINDALDSTGDRYGCIAYVPVDTTLRTLLSNGVFGQAGYSVGGSTGFGFYRYRNAANANTGTSNAPVLGALNIGCWWSEGNALNSKLNLGTTSTVTATNAEVAGTAYPHRIGRYDQAGYGFTGTIHEVVEGLGACPTQPCEVWAQEQMQRAFANGDSTRPLFSDAASDKLHLVGNAYTGVTAWAGPAWSSAITGTVGYSDAFVPAAGGNRNRAGHVTGADANYYGGVVGNDALDAAGDRWGAISFTPASTASAQYLFYNGSATTNGHGLQQSATGTVLFISNVPGAQIATTANAVTSGMPSTAFWWRTGNNISVKLNGGATVTVDAVAAEVSGTNAFAKVGRYETAGAPASATTIAEMVQGLGAPVGYASPEAWCIDQTAKAMAQGDPNARLFTPPSNTVLTLRGEDYAGGVYWASPLGAALKAGTVPSSDAFVPAIDGVRNRGGFGPFSATSSLKMTGGGPFNFPSGTGSICWVYRGKKTGSGATVEALGGTGTFNVSGWQFTDDGTMWVNGTGVHAAAALGAGLVADGLNVVCAGVNAGKAHGKANLVAFGSGAGTITYVVPTTDALIGGYSSTRYMSGSIYEVWVSSEAPSEALFTKVAQRVLSRSGTSATGSQTVSNTRSTWAALETPRPAGSTEPVLYMQPASVTLTSPRGLGAWKTATNALLSSRSACTAGNVPDPNWIFYQLACVNDSTTGPDGRLADTFTQSLVNGGPYQTRNHSATTTISTASVYGKMTGATAGYISAMARGAGLMTACTCARSDNGPCTPVPNALATTDCGAKALIPPGQWVRLSATVTTDTTNLASTCAYYPGEITVSTNSTAYLANFQCESGPYATPWIETLAASAQRNADVITTPMAPDFAYANLQPYTRLVGGGTFPTGWAITQSGGTSVPTASVVDDGTGAVAYAQTGTASRAYLVSTTPALTANTNYFFSALVEANSGLPANQIISATACPAGATVDYPLGAATVPTAGTRVYTRIVVAGTGGTCGLRLGFGVSADGSGALQFSRPMLTATQYVPTWIPTDAAGVYSTQKWCADGYYTAGGGREWAATAGDPVALGSAAQANTMRILADTAGLLYARLYDSAGTLRQAATTHGFTAGTTHRITACNNNGTLTLWTDAILRDTATTGGTGLWSGTPATANIGNNGGAALFDGYVMGHRLVKGVTTPDEIDNLFGK